jgi:aspartate racemase
MEEVVNPLGPAHVGLLATDATLASGLYVTRKVAGEGQVLARWILLTTEEVLTLVMPGLLAVKARQLESGRSLLLRAAGALHNRGRRPWCWAAPRFQ